VCVSEGECSCSIYRNMVPKPLGLYVCWNILKFSHYCAFFLFIFILF